MKTKLAQIVSHINTIDRRQLQAAYFVLMLAVSVVLRAPSDGGTGPI
jgi:hypothetical protein